MAILLAIVLGISTILVSQIKMIKGMENSVVAFYAADTGIEEVLNLNKADPVNPLPSPCPEANPCQLDNEARYYVEVIPAVDCGAVYYCLKSVGTYKNVSRAIEITY